MKTEEAIILLLEAARREGKSVQKLQEEIAERRDRETIREVEMAAGNVPPKLPDSQWQALRGMLRRGDKDVASPEQWVVRIAEAVRTSNQDAFWRAAIGLALSVRKHMPHLAIPALWEEQGETNA